MKRLTFAKFGELVFSGRLVELKAPLPTVIGMQHAEPKERNACPALFCLNFIIVGQTAHKHPDAASKSSSMYRDGCL